MPLVIAFSARLRYAIVIPISSMSSSLNAAASFAANGGLRGKFHRSRVILQVLALIKKLIKPNRERKRRLIEGMNFVILAVRFFVTVVILVIVIVRTAHFLFEHFFHFLRPSLAVLIEKMSPAHLPCDDLIAFGMVDVLLEKFHIFFRLPVLLLEEAFPIVFVPNFVGL
jgi:hypothetical protein